jgi:DNA-binding GntR family transcriptional regulator
MDQPIGISRRYLHDDVADRLRDLIRAGTFAPGDRLPEVELAERFGISRTPMREAIKILATEGLLDLLPNRGARVALVSERELAEMVEVIGGLEGLAGDLACQRLTEAELDGIRADHAAMLDGYQRRDAATYFAHNRAIHEAIVAACGNATLQALYQSLSARLNPMRFRAAMAESEWAAAVADHEAMITHLAARDGPALLALMRAHVRGKLSPIAATYGTRAEP